MQIFVVKFFEKKKETIKILLFFSFSPSINGTTSVLEFDIFGSTQRYTCANVNQRHERIGFSQAASLVSLLDRRYNPIGVAEPR